MKFLTLIICTLLAAAFTGCASTPKTMPVKKAIAIHPAYLGEPEMLHETAFEILQERGVDVNLHMSIYAVELLSNSPGYVLVKDANGKKGFAACDPQTAKCLTGHRFVWVALTSDIGKEGKWYLRVIDPQSTSKVEPFDSEALAYAK